MTTRRAKPGIKWMVRPARLRGVGWPYDRISAGVRAVPWRHRLSSLSTGLKWQCFADLRGAVGEDCHLESQAEDRAQGKPVLGALDAPRLGGKLVSELLISAPWESLSQHSLVAANWERRNPPTGQAQEELICDLAAKMSISVDLSRRRTRTKRSCRQRLRGLTSSVCCGRPRTTRDANAGCLRGVPPRESESQSCPLARQARGLAR